MHILLIAQYIELSRKISHSHIRYLYPDKNAHTFDYITMANTLNSLIHNSLILIPPRANKKTRGYSGA